MARLAPPLMISLLVRLKIDLLRAGVRQGGSTGQVGFVVAMVSAVLIGGGGGLTLCFTRLVAGRYRDDIALVVATVLFLGWIFLPVLAAAADGTLEVDRLATFPLTGAQMMPGLLAGSLVGAGGLVSVMVLLGLAGGLVPPSPLLAVTVAALVVLLALCAATSRLATTILSGAAKKRRWRDLAVFAAPMLALTLNVGIQVARPATSRRHANPDWFDSVGEVVGWLLSGLCARAIAAASDGRALAGVGWLAASIGVLAAVVAAWGWATRRVLTTASTATAGPRRSRRSGRLPLFGGVLAVLPRTRVGVVAAKELRLQWRDPRQRVALAAPLLSMAGPLVAFGLQSSSAGPGVVLLAALPGWLLGAVGTNVYGFDGPAHWVNVAAGDDARADLNGKVTAHAITAIVTVAVLGGVLALRTGHAAPLPAAIALAACAFGITTGLGLPQSVRHPLAMPDTPSNIFSTGNAGRATANIGANLLVLFGGAALIAPFAIAALVAIDHPVALVPASVAAAAVGAAATWLGLHRAIRDSAGRQPELLAALGDRKTA